MPLAAPDSTATSSDRAPVSAASTARRSSLRAREHEPMRGICRRGAGPWLSRQRSSPSTNVRNAAAISSAVAVKPAWHANTETREFRLHVRTPASRRSMAVLGGNRATTAVYKRIVAPVQQDREHRRRSKDLLVTTCGD